VRVLSDVAKEIEHLLDIVVSEEVVGRGHNINYL
jgi:hypothetical protein